MSQETTVILRAVLFQALRTNNVEEIRAAIKAMCSKDDIAAVKEQIAEVEAAIGKLKLNAVSM